MSKKVDVIMKTDGMVHISDAKRTIVLTRAEAVELAKTIITKLMP